MTSILITIIVLFALVLIAAMFVVSIYNVPVDCFAVNRKKSVQAIVAYSGSYKWRYDDCPSLLAYDRRCVRAAGHALGYRARTGLFASLFQVALTGWRPMIAVLEKLHAHTSSTVHEAQCQGARL